MRALVFLLAVLAAAPAWGQGRNNYGSIYSRYGVGQRMDFSTSQASSLGGAGVATRSGVYTTLSNPALWSDLSVTTFNASASVTGTRASDTFSETDSEATAGELEALHLGLPILPGKLGFVASYRPYSRVNYRASVPGTLIADGDTATYSINQEGSGGLQVISTGLGLRLGNVVQLGASADVHFGTVEYLQRTAFDQRQYVETRQAEATQLSGVSATFGGALTFRKILRDGDGVTFGGSVTLPVGLDGTRTRTLGESLDRDTVSAEVPAEVTLPLVARGGVSYRTGSRVMVAADVQYEPWNSFDSTVPFAGAASVDETQLADRLRVGGGVEFIPAGTDRRAGLFQRAAYRLGAFTDDGVAAPAGQSIRTTGVTAGVSFPTRLTGARLDLGIEAGTRGSEDGVLVRDQYLKGTVTLNFGERWFVRRRLD